MTQIDETMPPNSNSTFVEYCIQKLVSRVDGFPFTVLDITVTTATPTMHSQEQILL
jgi:hypothetical protein